MIVAGHQVSIEGATDPIYNGFDCCGTFQINQARRDLRQNDDLIYRFERALMGVTMEMTQRGFLVDMEERENAIRELGQKRANTWTNLENIISATGTSFTNKLPNSGKQLQHLFYDIMGLPAIKKSVMGETKFPMDRATLEKLELSDRFAAPIINGILNFRDLGKSLQVLETEIDNDWRWRCSYNIAGTKTGRFSSSKSPFMIYNESDQAWRQTGNNFQNISEILRRVFIPDPGYKLYGIDKAQSEARDVGWWLGTILNDWRYLDACESGDLHTNITRILYPEWNWTGNLRNDRQIAERRFYRFFTYRDASKRLGHACLTEDHEVLTPTGWISIKYKPETIMQWKEGESKFVNVSNWIDTYYTGILHEFSGRNISANMTSEHRIPYTPDQHYKIREKRASDGPGAFMPLGDGFIGGTDNVPGRLIAAFMSDGYQATNKTMQFEFKKERKSNRLIQLCRLYNVEIREGKGHNGSRKFYVPGRLPKRAGAFMLNWTRKSILDFLDEYKYWDGHIAKSAGQTLLYSVDESHLDWIKTLGRICGIGGSIWSEVMKTSYSQNTKLFRLSQNNRLYTGKDSIIWNKTIADNTRVFCPTVESGFFYIRRNGKISITGNSNYMGEPFEISRQTRIPLHLVQEFQDRYFDAFPIREMHQTIIAFLQMERYLINSYGRRRDFFDRPTDRETWKSAVAYMFQSATADAVNLGLYRLWKNQGTEVQILSQLHDAVYFQYPICSEKEEFDMLEKALNNIEITQRHKSGRTMTIPGEIVGGMNWAHRYRLLADGTKEDWNQNGLDGIKLQ